MVAVKDRRNGSRNPYAHLQQPGITLQSVQASPMLWDPVRYDETCPSSDGACAVVIGGPAAARDAQAAGRPVAWIRATSMRTEPTMFAGKDHVNPAGADAAAALWRQAGITDPRGISTPPRSTCRSRGSSGCGSRTSAFAAPGEGWRLTEAGAPSLDGHLPGNPSGGVLAPTPSAPPGMLRFGEAALQVTGTPATTRSTTRGHALGHAYGGGSQYFSVGGGRRPAGAVHRAARSLVGDGQALDSVKPSRAEPLRLAGLLDIGHAVGDRVEDQLDLQPARLTPRQ